jgi:hypothetical protein
MSTASELKPTATVLETKVKALGFNKGTVRTNAAHCCIKVTLFRDSFPEGFFDDIPSDLWISDPMPRAEGHGYEVIIEENLLNTYTSARHPEITEVTIEKHPGWGFRINGGNYVVGTVYCSIEQGREIAKRLFPNATLAEKVRTYGKPVLAKTGPWLD